MVIVNKRVNILSLRVMGVFFPLTRRHRRGDTRQRVTLSLFWHTVQKTFDWIHSDQAIVSVFARFKRERDSARVDKSELVLFHLLWAYEGLWCFCYESLWEFQLSLSLILNVSYALVHSCALSSNLKARSHNKLKFDQACKLVLANSSWRVWTWQQQLANLLATLLASDKTIGSL